MLNGALSIGRTGLNASQIGMNVTGNNISNAATAGYSRQRTELAAYQDQPYGRLRLGRGVQVTGIRRMADDALLQRQLAGNSGLGSAAANQEALSALQDAVGTLTADGSTLLGNQINLFFNQWSSLQSNPNNAGNRANVIAQGSVLAGNLRSTRASIASQTASIDDQLSTAASNVSQLVSEIARLNGQIASAGSGASSTLADQRDQLLGQLANLVDVTTVPQASGAVNVDIAGVTVVSDGLARGIKLDITSDGSGNNIARLVTTDNNQELRITSGRVGALLQQRAQGVDDLLNRIDRLTSELIYRVNRVYAEGSPLTAQQSLSGTEEVGVLDRPLAFNDPTNATFAGRANPPTSGTITLRVQSNATGAFSDVEVRVDLDGINNTGAAGFGDDTSLNSLIAQINAVPNLSASVDASGRLQITAVNGSSVAVTRDTSGLLTSLGVNTYFTGTDATDIGVRQSLLADSSTLNVRAFSSTGTPADNGIAKSMTALRDSAQASLGGNTLNQDWASAVQTLGVKTASANTALDTADTIAKNLENQRAAISGVNLDEEAINLVLFQTQYQASARYITMVQQMTETLLALVR